MKLLYFAILIPLFVSNEYIRAQLVLPPTNLNEYDAYGSLLAINEYLAIIAQNDQEQFTVITNPFTNRSIKCVLPYDTIRHSVTYLTRFVYNMAIGAKQNASQLRFAYIYENWRRDVFLAVVFLEPIDSGCVHAVNRKAINITDLNMQERALVSMDPYGKRAYAVGTYYIVCIEIETGVETQLDTEKLFGGQNNSGDLFFPKALTVTESHYIFIVGQRFTNLKFLPYLIVVNLSLYNVTLFSALELVKFNFGPSSIDITRYSTMSISLLDHVKQFIIGIPQLDMLLFLSWNQENENEKPMIVRRHISSQSGIFFGKSVALLDNDTFAVLAHALPTLPWSTSQVQVYSLHDNEQNNRPLIVYPNNQQIIPLLNSVPPPFRILTIISWNSHLGLVLDAGAALLLSTSPPGYCSAHIDDKVFDIGEYTSVPCLPGTARNTTSFGPCFLCPPNTKNNGTSGFVCETCVANDSLLCLRGSLVEIPLAKVTDYNQAVPYPNPPELNVFDDILLQNIFSLNTESSHCLVISPFLWIIVAAGISFIIFIVMCILLCFPQRKSHRTFLKKLFQHMDLIGEGEVWFGGLLTFAIVVALVFVCKFSIDFAGLYPSDAKTTDSCETTISNSKFSSTLQLLSIIRHEEEKPIFKMLDDQNITLSIHFISTGFLCSDVMVQENLDRGHQVPLDNFSCLFDQETSILSVSTVLPQHLVSMQFDLIGPYFIGGLHICFSGPSDVADDDKYILQEVRFCQFLYSDNETLTNNPTIDVKMTKVINRTIGFTVSEDISYSGIWIPTLTVSTLSDVLIFNERGEYTRYLSDRVTLVMDITESEFFVKNTQEPIARHTEIVLHTILVAIVFLDIFGLFFLIAKLSIVPIVKFIHRRFFSHNDRSLEKHDEPVQLTRFVQIPVNKVPKNVES